MPAGSISLNENYIGQMREFFPRLEVKSGLPTEDDLKLRHDDSRKLLILEDMMSHVLNKDSFIDLITNYSHHGNLSIIFTVQNLFFRAKNAVTIMRNFSEKVIFQSPGDIQLLRFLSLQISSNGNLLKEAFEKLSVEVAEQEQRYLLIDSSSVSHLPAKLQIRSKIFPSPRDGRLIIHNP